MIGADSIVNTAVMHNLGDDTEENCRKYLFQSYQGYEDYVHDPQDEGSTWKRRLFTKKLAKNEFTIIRLKTTAITTSAFGPKMNALKCDTWVCKTDIMLNAETMRDENFRIENIANFTLRQTQYTRGY